MSEEKAFSDYASMTYNYACFDSKRHADFWRDTDLKNVACESYEWDTLGAHRLLRDEPEEDTKSGTIQALVDGTLARLYEQQAAHRATRKFPHPSLIVSAIKAKRKETREEFNRYGYERGLWGYPEPNPPSQPPYCHLCHGHGYVLGLDATITRCDHRMVPNPAVVRYVAVNPDGDLDAVRARIRTASCRVQLVSLDPGAVLLLWPSLPDAMEHYVSQTFGPGRVPLEIETWFTFCQRVHDESMLILRVDVVDDVLSGGNRDIVTGSPHPSLTGEVP
jgi:hypothetical protein